MNANQRLEEKEKALQNVSQRLPAPILILSLFSSSLSSDRPPTVCLPRNCSETQRKTTSNIASKRNENATKRVFYHATSSRLLPSVYAPSSPPNPNRPERRRKRLSSWRRRCSSWRTSLRRRRPASTRPRTTSRRRRRPSRTYVDPGCAEVCAVLLTPHPSLPPNCMLVCAVLLCVVILWAFSLMFGRKVSPNDLGFMHAELRVNQAPPRNLLGAILK